MSSKLYKRYLSLKIEDNGYYYLFKSGIFYIFVDDDARIVAPLLNLKLTNLNSIIKKCGFPVSSQEKYFKKIEELNLRVKVVTLDDNSQNITLGKYMNIESIFETVEKFLQIDIDSLSISQAFDLLIELQEKFNKITKKKEK